MVSGGTVLVGLGVLATVSGVVALARAPRRRRWAQLVAAAGLVLVLLGLLLRSALPQPDPCADDDPHTCAIIPSSSP